MGGVVAAGHPLSAEAGAAVLREGGNAVDAAVAAALMSFVAESPLTGPGAGGFLLAHTAAGESRLLDFFVAAPGAGLNAGVRRPADLVPVAVDFGDEAVQEFNVGPASCGVPGTLAGLAEAAASLGSAPLDVLAAPAVRAAREGVEVTATGELLFEILEPVLRSSAEAAAIYAPAGRRLLRGERVLLPELGDLLERFGAEGADFLYRGDVARALSAWVLERGGLLTEDDLAGYTVVERAPARAHYRDREILTNPPPSSGGILIAYSLDLLSRLGRSGDTRALVEVMELANRARTADFIAGLQSEGYLERFLAAGELEAAAA